MLYWDCDITSVLYINDNFNQKTFYCHFIHFSNLFLFKLILTIIIYNNNQMLLVILDLTSKISF